MVSSLGNKCAWIVGVIVSVVVEYERSPLLSGLGVVPNGGCVELLLDVVGCWLFRSMDGVGGRPPTRLPLRSPWEFMWLMVGCSVRFVEAMTDDGYRSLQVKMKLGGNHRDGRHLPDV